MPKEVVETADKLDAIGGWFGNAGRLSVQRAIGDLRAGRPVKIKLNHEASLAVIAAEMLGGERIAAWNEAGRAPVSLILPAPRMRHLGFVAAGPSHVEISDLSGDQVDAMLFAVAPAIPVVVHRAANPLEVAALELVKHAYLLPAVAVLPASAEQTAEMIEVDATAVREFHERSAHELSIATRARVPLAEAAESEFVVFRGGDGLRDQIAIIVGRPDLSKPVPTRLHSACLTGDLFASLKCDCGDQLRLAVDEIAAAGGGVLLYLDQEGRGIGLLNKMRAYGLQELGHDTLEADEVLGYGPDERRYAVASAMLALLGIRRITLLTNNPEKVTALEGFGVEIVGQRRLIGAVNPHNQRYLNTKARRAGHMLGDIA